MEVIDLDGDYDPNFLSLLEAAEAEALAAASVTKSKRRKVSDQESVEVEGSYFAALRGSRSSLWQQQQQEKAKQRASFFTAGRGGGGDGACYKCGASGHWARDCTGAGGGGSGRCGPALDGDVEEKACPCGLGSCLVLTSTTAKNPGRKFYRCPAREENGGCNFFEWCDTPSSGLPTSGRASIEVRGPYGASRSFSEPRSIQRQASFSSQGPDSYSFYSGCQSSGERAGSSCFKCGQEGHWARDCTKSSSGSYSDAGERTGSSCFKCGQAGHWAKDCTVQDTGAGFGDRKAPRSFHTPVSKCN